MGFLTGLAISGVGQATGLQPAGGSATVSGTNNIHTVGSYDLINSVNGSTSVLSVHTVNGSTSVNTNPPPHAMGLLFKSPKSGVYSASFRAQSGEFQAEVNDVDKTIIFHAPGGDQTLKYTVDTTTGTITFSGDQPGTGRVITENSFSLEKNGDTTDSIFTWKSSLPSPSPSPSWISKNWYFIAIAVFMLLISLGIGIALANQRT